METVEDIVKETREHHILTTAPCACWVMRKEELIELCDRLEAAYKRDMQAMVDAGEIDMRTAIGEVERLRDSLAYSAKTLAEYRDENARLKTALKPVQDAHIPDFSICDTCRDRSECEKNEDSETCEWYDIVEAVREAHKIYNGGEA